MSKELDEYFEFKCRKGFDDLKLSGKEYADRLDYEIACIKKMGFPGYMLIVQDLLGWATRNNILCGPGRGSAAGSLVCYVLNITKVDPIKHGLIFERFLNPDRISMPDIDMDFEIDRREEVVDYVKTVYGVEKVARITTFSAMNSKGAIRDVARAMDLSYMESDTLAKTLVDGSVKDNMKNNLDFANLIQEDVRFKEVANLAARLEGNIRHCVSGATRVILPNAYSYTVKNLYKQKYRGKIRAYNIKDDVLFFDDVMDIFCTGRKETIKITVAKQSIRTTKDHLFLTKNGWVEAQDLKVGQLVARNGKKKNDGKFQKGQIPWNSGIKGAQITWNKGLKKEDHYSIQLSSERMHVMNRDPEIKERARLNSIKHGRYAKEFHQYLPEHPTCEQCNKKDSSIVHHKDGNPHNNDPENLIALCRSCHSKAHNIVPTHEIKANTTIKWGSIVSIEDGGEEETYDITMKSCNHNFVANRFVVHNCGIHAAGVVIGDKRLDEYMPVYTSRKTGDNLTQFAMNEVEEVGLIKFDFLGLKNLSIIHMAQDLIKGRHSIEINLDELTDTLDDPKVIELFANGDTTNVFQFESDGMKKYLKRLKPTCFEDIAAMNALYRPSGLDSGIIDDYIARKNDPSLIEYPHECLEPHLKDTLGLMVFQENQMKVCEILAGYTLAEADTIRKTIGKKKMEELKKERPKFVRGCMAKGLSKSDSEGLFDDLEKAGRYSFNKSHSYAYSFVAYWTAWLKVYYPLEYMTAVLSYEVNDREALFKYVSEAKRMGIEFLAPDVNKSLPYFSIEDEKIRYALAAIEGIGVDTSEEIVKKREQHGDFFSIRGLVELTNSKKVTSQVIENLIKAGGFDALKLDKDYMLELIEPAVIFKKKKASKEKKNQLALFERKLELDDFKIDQETRPPKVDRDKYETEALGFFLFDNPLKDYTTLINQNATHTIAQVRDCEVSKDDKNGVVLAGYINSVKKVKRKKDGAPMAFMKLSDGMNEVEVCVFTAMYNKLESILNKNALVMFSGQYKCSDNGGQLIAKGGTLLDSLPKLKTDKNKGFFNFTLSDGTKIILEAKEKLTYIPKLRKIFDNCKEGIS